MLNGQRAAVAIGWVCAFVLSPVRPAIAQALAPPPPAITTQGEAMVQHAPDQAWIVMAIDAQAPVAADARHLGAQAMTDLQTALKALALAPDAIRTLGYSLEPQYSRANNKQTLIGYVAHNQIEVRVDHLEKLPDVIETANSAKDVTVSLVGPRYDVKDRETITRRLLTEAVANAMDRAKAMAEGAHMSLGAIQSVENETPSVAPQVMMRSMAYGPAAAPPPAPTPINAGDLEIRATVRLTVAIVR